MSEIEVRTTGDQEASDGVVELWLEGEQIAFTHYDPTTAPVAADRPPQ
jgi:hypothetical protein